MNFDFVIIGSGFGGSVSALRLAEKGYRVAVLETGRRLPPSELPKTNWNLRKFLWAPWLRCFGLQRITFLKGLTLLHGAGVGGGSLVYAATLMQPESAVFKAAEWPSGIDWNQELQPFFQRARQMLGVRKNPYLGPADEALKKVAHEMNCENTFHPTEVGIFFGEAGKSVPDPFFNGEGPSRSGCVLCGGCMVGCRYGAKNTLDQNYLYLAERQGVRIFPETTATRLIPTDQGYVIETTRSTSWLKRKGPVFQAKKVIVAAGVLGSVELLLKNKSVFRTLPRISDQLGKNIRTNGESLLGATSLRQDTKYSEGIAIGSAFHPDPGTKIEAVRYPEGSGAMRFLGIPLTEDGSVWVRPLKLFINLMTKAPQYFRLWTVRDWARNSIILLVMQTKDHHIDLTVGPSIRGRRLQRSRHGARLPSFMPVAQKAGKILARLIQGVPQNVITEVLMATPTTAPILGGCRIGQSPKESVIDSQHQVFGYPGLYVCDGSVIPSNLGVNPSLTITALAERFADQIPVNKSPTD